MNRPLLKVLGVCLFFGVHMGCFSGEPGKEAPLPVPDGAKIKESESLVRDLFKAEYAKRGAEDCLALARRLLKQAAETKDDPNARYVLVSEAQRLAVEAGGVEDALRAVDAMSNWYLIDAPKEKGELLSVLSKKAAKPEDHQVLGEAYIKLAEEAVHVDDFLQATKFNQAAQQAARAAQDMPLLTSTRAQETRLRTLQNQYNQARRHLMMLKQNPEDPPANLAVGKYKCLTKGEWEEGLPFLKRGSDPVLKALAEREGTVVKDGKVEMVLGDGWWDLAKKERDAQAKENLAARAEYWYVEAMRLLQGLSRVKARNSLIETRLSQGPPMVMLADIKPCVVTVGYGTLGLKGELGHDGKKVAINGKKLMNCLSLCPAPKGESSLRFVLQLRYTSLKGAVALNDTAVPKSESELTFKVLADDGRELWVSKPVQTPRAQQAFDIDVRGVEFVDLQVVCPGSNANAQAVWVEPVLSR